MSDYVPAKGFNARKRLCSEGDTDHVPKPKVALDSFFSELEETQNMHFDSDVAAKTGFQKEENILQGDKIVDSQNNNPKPHSSGFKRVKLDEEVSHDAELDELLGQASSSTIEGKEESLSKYICLPSTSQNTLPSLVSNAEIFSGSNKLRNENSLDLELEEIMKKLKLEETKSEDAFAISDDILYTQKGLKRRENPFESGEESQGISELSKHKKRKSTSPAKTAMTPAGTTASTLALTLQPYEYPEMIFTNEHLFNVFDLVKEIVNNYKEGFYLFDYAYLRDGAIIVSCIDQRSKSSFAEAVEGSNLEGEVVHLPELETYQNNTRINANQKVSAYISLKSESKTKSNSMPSLATHESFAYEKDKNESPETCELDKEDVHLNTQISILVDKSEEQMKDAPHTVEINQSNLLKEALETPHSTSGEASTSKCTPRKRKNAGPNQSSTVSSKERKMSLCPTRNSRSKGTFKLTIICASYPKMSFTEKDLLKLEDVLVHLIDSFHTIPGRDFYPGIFCIYLYNGRIIVYCTNEWSKQWLADIIEGSDLNGKSLRCSKPGELSSDSE